METIAVIALVLAATSLICCGALTILCIALLHPSDSRYTELAEKVDELGILLDLCGEANKQLFRYVEALDDATGGTGHHVLLSSLRNPSPRRIDDATY